MKKAIIYILIILSTGLLACLAADAFMQKGFKKSDDDVIGKLNEIINDSSYYDVLCVGSSRALAHFNPQLIEKELSLTAFNAGLNGACIVDFNLLLKAYLIHHAPPKVLVMHIDDFTLESDHLRELPRYFPYIENPVIYNSLKPYNETVGYIHRIPFLRIMYYYDLLKWVSIKSWLGIAPRNEYKLINGYRENNSQWNAHFEEGLNNRIEKIKALYPKTDVEVAGIKLLIELLDICKSHHIKIVFSSSPILYGNLDKLYKNTELQIEKYSKGYDVSYLWMHDEDWPREIYFYDYLHMNSSGADRYSKTLAEFIKSSTLQ
jgi:hypothetical protein